jgi:hypothetical protein
MGPGLLVAPGLERRERRCDTHRLRQAILGLLVQAAGRAVFLPRDFSLPGPNWLYDPADQAIAAGATAGGVRSRKNSGAAGYSTNGGQSDG